MRKAILKIIFVLIVVILILSSFDIITLGRARSLNNTSQQFLESPPAEAIAYDIVSPLRNGKNVIAKKRWVSVPDGQTIEFLMQSNGKYLVDYPEGTRLWKEFYIETMAGVFLIERRLTSKLSDGWAFASAYTMPKTPLSLDDLFPWNLRTIELQKDNLSSMLFKPTDSLPLQNRAAALNVHFDDENSSSSSYMFPGTRNCSTCHQGANAAFANADSNRVLAFGIHPQNLTSESLRRLIQAQKVKIDRQEIAALPEIDAQTNQVVAMMRNNCLSCHNEDTKAAAQHTAFRLDPTRQYSKNDLVNILSVRSLRFGVKSQPLLTRGNPEESELVLRMRGAGGRLRMPPADGGVPVIDDEFALLVENWIRSL